MASAEDLANLTGMVNRYNSLTTRKERLDFLLTRNRTDGFIANLWSAPPSTEIPSTSLRCGPTFSRQQGVSLHTAGR